MQVDFVRFKASDGVDLRGWFSDGKGDIAVIHIHGMSGNGYENYFLDNLRAMFTKNAIAFFPIDTRGSGIINTFAQTGKLSKWGEGDKLGGSCFEIFEESVADIAGAINLLKTRGKSKFILTGHSLGGSKVVNYLVSKKSPEVIAAVLLAPTDMVGWASTDPKNVSYLAKAHKLLEKNKGTKLVAAECWLDETPLSAQTYPSICAPGRPVDIYGHEGVAPLSKLTTPTLIAYGDSDIGIQKVDGSYNKWFTRTTKIKHPNTEIAMVSKASHSFSGFEDKLTIIVEKYLKNLIK